VVWPGKDAEDFVAGSLVENPDESFGVVVGWEQMRTERVRTNDFFRVLSTQAKFTAKRVNRGSENPAIRAFIFWSGRPGGQESTQVRRYHIQTF